MRQEGFIGNTACMSIDLAKKLLKETNRYLSFQYVLFRSIITNFGEEDVNCGGI